MAPEFNPTEDSVFCPGTDVLPVPQAGVEPETKAVAGAVVYLEQVQSGQPLELLTTATGNLVQIEDCRTTPSLIIVPVGGLVEFRSMDPVVHDLVLSTFRGNTEEFLLPVRRDLKVMRFREDGRYRLRCRHHPWEYADILVVEHPYYTLTAADGTFSLPDIRPGAYRVVALYNGACLEQAPADDTSTSFTLGAPAAAGRRVYLNRGSRREVNLQVSPVAD